MSFYPSILPVIGVEGRCKFHSFSCTVKTIYNSLGTHMAITKPPNFSFKTEMNKIITNK